MREPILRLLILTAFALCAAPAAAAQGKCVLERAVAPDYGGVMLGMSVQELRKMFPAAQELEAAAATGVSRASLGMLDLYIRKDSFKGVDELRLTFIGGRLHRIDVRFRRPPEWEGIGEFSEQMSKRLAVPADAWGPPFRDAVKHSRLMECRGFALVVRIEHDGPSLLSIVDTTDPAPPEAGGPAGAAPRPD